MLFRSIPTTTQNQIYTDNVVKNIYELYPDRDYVEVIVEVNDSATLGINYNNAVSKAKGDKVILLHNDMVLSKGFVELMDKHIAPKRITTYTRVEPPIYPDIYPGKVLLECGRSLSDFDHQSPLSSDNLPTRQSSFRSPCQHAGCKNKALGGGFCLSH